MQREGSVKGSEEGRLGDKGLGSRLVYKGEPRTRRDGREQRMDEWIILALAVDSSSIGG